MLLTENEKHVDENDKIMNGLNLGEAGTRTFDRVTLKAHYREMKSIK